MNKYVVIFESGITYIYEGESILDVMENMKYPDSVISVTLIPKEDA